MNKQELEEFLQKARSQTYAASVGKSESLLPGAIQYEYSDGSYGYQDVYYIGNGIFSGLETVFYNQIPSWCMSYFGDFSNMTEEQTDRMLRRALLDLKEVTRTYRKVERAYQDFTYTCKGQGTIDKLSGTEKIFTGAENLYYLIYSGGYIGQ